MRFANLIFDLDGTLVDSLPGIEASIEYTIRQIPGLELPASLRPHIGPPIPKMFRTMWPQIAPAELEKRVAIFRKHYDEEGFRGSRLYPAVHQILSSLRAAGLAMFVLTNKPALATRRILQETAILDFFAAVVSPDSVAPAFASKAEGAEHMGREHRLEPSQTVVVGDGADDARAAAHCGFAFILARYGYGAAALDGAADAVAVLESFEDLLHIQIEP